MTIKKVKTSIGKKAEILKHEGKPKLNKEMKDKKNRALSTSEYIKQRNERQYGK